VTLRGIILCVLLLGSAAVAVAAPVLEDEPIARAHYMTGLAYYDKGDYHEAVREFVAAYALAPRAPLLYNIARAYEKLGDAGRAIDFYQRFLKTGPDAIEHDAAAVQITALRGKVGEVVVDSNMSGVSIVIDGEPSDHGTADPIPLTAGPHRITLRREGAVDSTLDAKVRPGAIEALRFDLTSVAQLRTDARHARRGRWLWPVVGVAAAIAVGTAITLGLTLHRTDYTAEARADCPAQTCAVIDGSK
jgi:tetratricopeptide (TPR) repeat protein